MEQIKQSEEVRALRALFAELSAFRIGPRLSWFGSAEVLMLILIGMLFMTAAIAAAAEGRNVIAAVTATVGVGGAAACLLLCLLAARFEGRWLASLADGEHVHRAHEIATAAESVSGFSIPPLGPHPSYGELSCWLASAQVLTRIALMQRNDRGGTILRGLRALRDARLALSAQE